MKVLHIIPNLRKGGAERLCIDTCLALRNASGVEVLLINLHPENTYSFLTMELNRKIVPAKVVPSVSGKSMVEVEALQREVDVFQPDVIHVHLFEALMVVSHLRHTAHLVIHFHDNMMQFENFSWRTLINKQRLTNFFEKRLVLKSLKQHKVSFIGISSVNTDYIRKVIPQYQSQIHLLHNAIDASRFIAIKQHRNSRPTLITIGTLNTNKNHRLAIEVLKHLIDEGLPVQLIIVGDGPQRNELHYLAKKLGVDQQVQFTGSVDNPEYFLEQADLYIHTAKSEAFGLTILEAMAASLPVVCTDGGGNRDLIRNGENGFILETEKPEAFADKIEHLLKNTEQRIRMGSNAQRFAQTFDIKSYAERLMAIYTAKS